MSASDSWKSRVIIADGEVFIPVEYTFPVAPLSIAVPYEQSFDVAGLDIITVADMAAMTGNLALAQPSGDEEKQRELIDYLASPQFQQDLDAGIREIHQRYGGMILSMAKSLCPVRTGFLQNSLYLITYTDGVAIDSDCAYFPIIEARYHMVASAYAFYEPLMLAEIELLIINKASVEQ